jgi:hypothetical protein
MEVEVNLFSLTAALDDASADGPDATIKDEDRQFHDLEAKLEEQPTDAIDALSVVIDAAADIGIDVDVDVDDDMSLFTAEHLPAGLLSTSRRGAPSVKDRYFGSTARSKFWDRTCKAMYTLRKMPVIFHDTRPNHEASS